MALVVDICDYMYEFLRARILSIPFITYAMSLGLETRNVHPIIAHNSVL